ncbi:MAG: hypothetical protein MHPSP_004891, partial [Paramarteilia canceri]
KRNKRSINKIFFTKSAITNNIDDGYVNYEASRAALDKTNEYSHILKENKEKYFTDESNEENESLRKKIISY